MNAEEMFKELGYRLVAIFENYMWFKKEVSEDDSLEIVFNFENKIIIKSTNFNYIGEINVEELKAINKQVKELGWT